MTTTHSKWGAGAWLNVIMIVESFAASVAFLIAKDMKHAAYWFFGGCINLTVLMF